MKNAPNRKKAIEGAADQGAVIIAPGAYPVKTNAVCAEVLARLLNGERMNSDDTLDKCSTMRAAAHINYLHTSYNWHFLTEDKATGCRDGRVSWVAEYRLPPETIERAMAAGAGAWIAKVRKDRAALRAKAAEAYRKAQALNAARKRQPPPGQFGLFEGGAA